MATQYFKVPEQYVGKSLYDLRRDPSLGQVPFSPGVIGDISGIDPNARFTAGQTLGFRNQPGSAEYQFLQKYFQPGLSPQQQQAQDKEKQVQDILQQGKQESISTLEAGKQPLKERYQSVIDSITGRANLRQQEADIATAREFGKRGISTQSGVFDKAVQQARLPIDTALATSLSDTALQEQSALNAIDAAIANIQQATSRDQVDAALSLYQIGQNALQNQLSLDESARQFDEQLALDRELGQSESSNPYSNYITLGEGQTLFDLNTLQNIFKNPKTYKGTGSDNDPAGIL